MSLSRKKLRKYNKNFNRSLVKWKNASRFKRENLVLLKREKIDAEDKERSLEKLFVRPFWMLEKGLNHTYKLNLSAL